MYRYLLVLILVAFMGGCSAYHPFKDGEGYSEIPMGRDNFQVTFVGGSSLTVLETREDCLIRAAELSVLQGDAYFRIVDEKVFLSYGSSYYPPTYEPGYAYVGRRGYIRREPGWYDPGYTEVYTIPEVTMRVALEKQPGENSIPAAFLIDKAVWRKLQLTPGVVEQAANMPRTGAQIPAPPQPTTRPLTR